MYCENCEKESITSASKVIDSRTKYANVIYRRRECLRCGHRWTTYEIPKTRLQAKQTITRTIKKLGTHLGKFSLQTD